MSVFRSQCVALIGLAVALAGTSAAAQTAQQAEIDPETTTRVTVGRSSGQPDTTAMVPIYFTPPSTRTVGYVRLQVTYVSANIHFEKIEAGPAAESGQVGLKAEVTTGKNEAGIPTETVTITAGAPAASAGGIPKGLLAYLTLRARPEARPAKITLRSSASASGPGSDAPLPDVQSFDGELEVQAPNTGPTVVCFFFTH